MRPKITLKLATSLDGKIALENGESQWVTSEAARAHGRQLRTENDAIAVGVNTAMLDNPRLTSRTPSKTDPIRIVFDSSLRLSLDSHLIATAKETPTWIFSAGEAFIYPDLLSKAQTVRTRGVNFYQITGSGGLNLEEALDIMTAEGIRSLLVEGGGTLIASFIRAGLFDKIHWYRAPVLLGGDGRDCVGALSLTNMNQAIRLHRIKTTEVGIDQHEVYVRAD